MTQTLFDVIVLYHEQDSTAGPRLAELRKAFESAKTENDVTAFNTDFDPWKLVSFNAFSKPDEFEQHLPEIGKRVLYILLINEKMVDEQAWIDVLEIVASALPKEQGLRNALCFVSSEEAQNRLPGKLRERQSKESSVLGERRMRPHTLALLALHRARLSLGVHPEKNKLKLFISHAKVNGLFLAQAIIALIKQAPELEEWYDVYDLQNGGSWSDDIETAAANGILIAIRTEGYQQSSWCRREFETALAHGAPIVVVNALLNPSITPALLPYSAMPNIRIPDGNTNRILRAALREHLRLLLLETLVADRTPPTMPADIWRVWPRLPSLSSIRKRAATITGKEYWLLPQDMETSGDYIAVRDWLTSTNSPLSLEAIDSFLLFADSIATPLSSVSP